MSGWRTLINRPRLVKVESVVDESPEIRTLIFRDGPSSAAVPGQFIMVWILGVDENPMSISMAGPEDLAAVTVRGHTPNSRVLYDSQVGSFIGVRGPYGNSFTLTSGRSLVVGGGTGLAPLLPLVEKLQQLGGEVTLVAGAKTVVALPFKQRTSALSQLQGVTVKIATEDGSRGAKALASQLAEKILATHDFDRIYTCGPEPMMHRVFHVGEKRGIPLETSLERVMKCGVGLCGSCTMGKYVLCTEGPVLDSARLREVSSEFGVHQRDHCGRKVPF
ncbi:MAG: dihydroorotate dehydrogenase electron transfer subunit [Candidatus Bathyarchaeia archaeon]